MAEKTVTIGIKSIKLFKNAADGTPATDAIVIGDTLEDSFSITQEDGTTVDINIEESDSAIYSKLQKGAKTFTYQVPNVDYEELAKLWGTYDAVEGFSEPDVAENVDCKIEIATMFGSTITFNRASMSFAFDGSLGKNNALQLTVSGSVLKPLGALKTATYKN